MPATLKTRPTKPTAARETERQTVERRANYMLKEILDELNSWGGDVHPAMIDALMPGYKKACAIRASIAANRVIGAASAKRAAERAERLRPAREELAGLVEEFQQSTAIAFDVAFIQLLADKCAAADANWRGVLEAAGLSRSQSVKDWERHGGVPPKQSADGRAGD